MKKWIAVICLVCIVGCTSPQKTSEYDNLVKIADRQAVEIAIIEQAIKLASYKQQMAQSQQQAEEVMQIVPVMPPSDPNK